MRHPLLAPLVHCLWWAAPAPGAPPQRERIVPTGRAQVVLSTGSTGNVVVGPMSRSVDIERNDGAATVGVSFHAGGATPFLMVPAEQLTDATIDLESIWALRSLPDRLAELAADPAFDLLEAELLQRFCPEGVSPPVLAAERAIRSGASAGAVAALVGEDRRRLVPEFRRVVGVGPKHYERIQRFSRSIEAIRHPQPWPLAEIAAHFGYADQAHLTREFTHFAGVTPSRVVGDAPKALNHIDADKIFKT